MQWALDGAVAVVTLTKPPHNLIDDAMLEALVAAYRETVEAGARAILLRSDAADPTAGLRSPNRPVVPWATWQYPPRILAALDIADGAVRSV